MPESVEDRCTRAHEYLYLLAKAERYYFDARAIAERATSGDLRRPYGSPGANALDPRGHQGEGKPRRAKNDAGAEQSAGRRMLENTRRARAETGQHDGHFGEWRNKRSVWRVPTASFPGGHFATFPPDLIKPCILAGCPEGGIVLDPFAGSGTTGLVANALHRRAVLFELNPDYVKLAEGRIHDSAPLLAQVERA